MVSKPSAAELLFAGNDYDISFLDPAKIVYIFAQIWRFKNIRVIIRFMGSYDNSL